MNSTPLKLEKELKRREKRELRALYRDKELEREMDAEVRGVQRDLAYQRALIRKRLGLDKS